MEEDYGDLHLDIPEGPSDEDWLASMEASVHEVNEDHMEGISEEELQDDLQLEHVSFSEFEVVGNVNTPQSFVEPTPRACRDHRLVRIPGWRWVSRLLHFWCLTLH